MVHAKSYKILCLWFLSFRSRHKEKWTDLLVLRLAALGRQEFYATSNIQVTYNFVLMVSCRDAHSSDSPKNEGIKGNRALRVEKIRRNRATIALAKFLSTLSRVRSGFNGLPCSKSGRSERGLSSQFWVFFKCLAPYGADSFFQRYRRHTQKSELILRYIEEY